MNAEKLFRNYGIIYVTEGHKHAREGWVNCACPFCTGNPGFHLGWNTEDEYFYCWRCGWHPPARTISALLKIPESEAFVLLQQYGVNKTKIKKVKISVPFKTPSGLTELSTMHRKYLEKRNFDPDKITNLWKIQGTGPVSKLDKIDYRFRIFIPYFWNGEMVTFDTRDITNKQTARYKACPETVEKIHRKSILYGNQEHWGEVGICVEGATDVWRLGTNACAVSGIQFTREQVRVLSQTFKHIVIIFDEEPQAQAQAKKLVAELRFRGVFAENVKIKGDPASLSQNEADNLLKSIL